MTFIKQHVDSVSAVLILADGMSPGMNIDIDCILSALSTLIPKTLFENIAFVLTRVWDPSFSDFLRSRFAGRSKAVLFSSSTTPSRTVTKSVLTLFGGVQGSPASREPWTCL